MNRRGFLATSAILTGAALYGGRGAATATDGGRQPGSRLAAIAVAYARARTGFPYVWGGTGQAGFDCSGLVMMAYRAAGIALPRTSQEQWAAGHRVTSPRPGDLVFFPGSDGTWTQPGHVGIVTGPGRLIEAYAPGTGIVATTYGQESSLPGTGPGTVVGYTRPSDGV